MNYTFRDSIVELLTDTCFLTWNINCGAQGLKGSNTTGKDTVPDYWLFMPLVFSITGQTNSHTDGVFVGHMRLGTTDGYKIASKTGAANLSYRAGIDFPQDLWLTAGTQIKLYCSTNDVGETAVVVNCLGFRKPCGRVEAGNVSIINWSDRI